MGCPTRVAGRGLWNLGFGSADHDSRIADHSTQEQYGDDELARPRLVPKLAYTLRLAGRLDDAVACYEEVLPGRKHARHRPPGH